jgi:hypothetical protein
MTETAYDSPWDRPEESMDEILVKISAFASSIRCDWIDPRADCREIWRLCKKAQGLYGGREVAP